MAIRSPERTLRFPEVPTVRSSACIFRQYSTIAARSSGSSIVGPSLVASLVGSGERGAVAGQPVVEGRRRPAAGLLHLVGDDLGQVGPVDLLELGQGVRQPR